MGKHRDLPERLARAEELVERNRKAMERHEKRAKRLRDRGEYEMAHEACNRYDRSKKLLGKWQKEVRRLTMQLRTREVLTQRAPQVEPKPGRPLLSDKQRRLADREAKAEQQRIEEKKKRMSAAGLDWDPRTAQGRRHVDLANMGASLRASINHFNTCLRKKSDRTDARVLAWSKFDTHCHKVHAGLIANPKYEPGVDVSTLPAVSDSRLDALRDDADLRGWLGRDMHGLLVEVIYHQKHFRELEGLAYLDTHEIQILFRRALDLTAAWFKVGEDNSFGREPRRIFRRLIGLDFTPPSA
jgi:hypothetical protein